jgi:hypothetical protein
MLVTPATQECSIQLSPKRALSNQQGLKWDFGCLVMGFVTKGMPRVNLALISVRSRTKDWVYGEKIISC